MLKERLHIVMLMVAAVIAPACVDGCRSPGQTTFSKGMLSTSSIEAANRSAARKLMDRYFLEGSILEMREQYPEALREYRRALRFDSTGAIFYAIAKCYRELGEKDSALMFARSAVVSDSTNTGARMQLAELLLETGRLQRAVEEFEEVVRRRPNNMEARYLLARLWHNRSPERAIVHYEYIIHRIPDDFDAMLNLSELYLNKRCYDRAIDVLKGMLRIRPENPDLYRILGDTYVQAERFDEAIALTNDLERHIGADSLVEQYYDNQLESLAVRLASTSAQAPTTIDYAARLAERATKKCPGSWMARLRSGIIFDRLAQPERSDSLMGSALGDTASTVTGWLLAADALIGNGQYSRAFTVLTPSSSRYDDARVPYYLGVACQRTGHADSAEKLLRRSLAINEDNAPAWEELAVLYGRQGHIGASRSAYEKAISYDPDNPEYLNNYAYVLAQENINLERALTLIKQALEIEPENEAFLDTIGWVYFKLEDYDRALEYIRRSVDIGGAGAEVIEHLGDVYRARGDAASARETYQRALKIAPDNIEIRKKLETVK